MEETERDYKAINDELQKIKEWLHEKFPEEEMRTRVVLSLVS